MLFFVRKVVIPIYFWDDDELLWEKHKINKSQQLFLNLISKYLYLRKWGNVITWLNFLLNTHMYIQAYSEQVEHNIIIVKAYMAKIK